MSNETDQASEQSVTDRIASKFGFGPQDQAETEEVEAVAELESDLADIDWEGVQYKVPSKLKEAFMKNEDYTRKTQELAESRKQIDHFREMQMQRQIESQFGESVATEQQQIAVIDAYLSQAQKVSWENMTTEQMLRHKVEIDNVKEQRQMLRQSIDSKRSSFTEQMQTKLNQLRGQSREIASKSINGFTEAVESEMRAFAIKEGMGEKEIDSIFLDPRSYKLVYKAMQFDKVQQGTGRVQETVGKVLKPGAASERMPASTVNKLNFAKAMKAAKTSGQKANVIEGRLANIFK